jgi:hypothetical protein
VFCAELARWKNRFRELRSARAMSQAISERRSDSTVEDIFIPDAKDMR